MGSLSLIKPEGYGEVGDSNGTPCICMIVACIISFYSLLVVSVFYLYILANRFTVTISEYWKTLN